MGLLVAASVASIGIFMLSESSAVSTTVSTEAEDALLSSVSIVEDDTASGQQYIQFAASDSNGGSLLKSASSFTKHADLRYSNASPRLLLDLYTPDHEGPYPLIIWVHGGGWIGGSKEECLPAEEEFMLKGFAVACINYRLSDEAAFPAQVIDFKSAVRWLRANAETYNLYAEKIGVWGESVGGHAAAFLGTSGNVDQFDKGENLEYSSSVQAVVDYYGPTDLVKFVQTPGYTDHAEPDSPESKFLGGPVLESQEKARQANPITYITADDPPFLIYHGDEDSIVPPEQSQILHDALQAAGVSSKLTYLPGVEHGGAPIFDDGYRTPELMQEITAFFDTHLR